MLVLGGRSEIGVAVAERLAGDDAGTVVLAARRPAELDAERARVRAAGAEVDTVAFDADDLAGHRPLLDDVLARHGRIDVAVVAFGILGDQEPRGDRRRARRRDRAHRLPRPGAPAHRARPGAACAGERDARRLLVGRGGAGAPRQLRLRQRQGRTRRVRVRPRRRAPRLGGPSRADPAGLRGRPDDRGHEPGPAVVHTGAGRRRDRAGRPTWPRQRRRLGPRHTPAALPRAAPAAARRVAADAPLIVYRSPVGGNRRVALPLG
ncbi:oxidoreductase, short-chain dehydrogenase/reductase family [Pseudonocardia sp. Ae168_Ps1]|nr:oxidoreductase, short-chain dehydrogenase/reductase family [Pseudonocardia sp. Ae168_Ps1]OLL92734.1 oxidoreductase, short-chain dehydrogenase/reductase family [Pseudonocardia sp. Ae356_Ps1]